MEDPLDPAHLDRAPLVQYARTRYRPKMEHCPCRACRAEVQRVIAEHNLRQTPEGRFLAGPETDGRPLWERFEGHYERCEYVNPERAFAEAREKECRPRPGLNFGQGLVQDLFFRHEGYGLLGASCDRWLTRWERAVAAAVVQWFGTNCGMAFLNEALKRCGMTIVPVDWYRTATGTGPKPELTRDMEPLPPTAQIHTVALGMFRDLGD